MSLLDVILFSAVLQNALNEMNLFILNYYLFKAFLYIRVKDDFGSWFVTPCVCLRFTLANDSFDECMDATDTNNHRFESDCLSAYSKSLLGQ